MFRELDAGHIVIKAEHIAGLAGVGLVLGKHIVGNGHTVENIQLQCALHIFIGLHSTAFQQFRSQIAKALLNICFELFRGFG